MLTNKGKEYFAKIITGAYPTALNGADKIGIYGSTGGGADAIIGSLQDTDFSAASTAGGFYSTIYTSSDLIFPVPGDTIVKGFVVFSTDIGTTFGTDEIYDEDFENKIFTNEGAVTLDSGLALGVTGANPNMTLKGSYELSKALAGDYSSGYVGFNKVAIFGSVGGASDDIIGVVQSVTWGTPTSAGAPFSASQDFTIGSANTVVKKVILFSSVLGTASGDEVVSYTLPTYATFDYASTFRVDSYNYLIY